MLNVEHFAITLGRTLELVRAQADKDEQKAALRALVALTKLDAATVTRDDDAIAIGDTPIPQTLPHIAVFTAQMSLHKVGQVAIAKDASAADLLNVLRGLAADPAGGVDLVHRMKDAKVMSVLLTLEGTKARKPAPRTQEAAPGRRRSASVTQAFDQAGILAAAGEAPQSPGGDPIARLNADPTGPGILDRLAAVAALVNSSAERGAMVRAVTALASLVRREGGLPDSEAKRLYAATIKELLTKYLLSQVARMVVDPYVSRDALQVVRWMGLEGRDAVLELLGESTLEERRAYFDAIHELHNGADAMVRLLNHHQVHIVQNVAELLGDRRFEPAVPDLISALKHYDARVRRAAAMALAHVGTAATVEPLKRALADKDPELRAGIANAIGGKEAGALAQPIAAAADAEENPIVQAECYKALGRIGTADAVQALVKAAQPAGRLRKKRALAARLAAIEGLKLAGGPAAYKALDALTDDDPDQDLRDAARHAAEAIKRRPGPAATEG